MLTFSILVCLPLDLTLKRLNQKIYFGLPGRTKMQRIYKMLFNLLNVDHEYFRCLDILYNKLEVICSDIALDKLDLVCEETVKDKSNIDYSDFINYSNTIYFTGLWLDNCDYFITQ